MNTSLEDYLKNIYYLQTSSGKVTNMILAEKMNVSSAAVSEMISKISKSGYIKNVPYKGFELTKKGENLAINLVRKHRIWEVFLVKNLKFSWEKVHSEAENLEHASSDELISQLEIFLGNPKFDPHGHPIPDKYGNIPESDLICLSEMNVGQCAYIKQVSDESSEVLEYLSKAGLKLNDKIIIKEKIGFDNSIQVSIKSQNIFLSEKLSKNIFVSIKQ
ncbi:MAG TPA: metal-dependent transcriptional regulator [Ignavibacteria bacterium]|nr:metal-dependent transcriptional regulator [Ignavibacteria bacterium]